MAMPLSRLRNLDVFHEDQEKLLQEVINYKLRFEPVKQQAVNRNDVPDKFKDQAHQAYWQNIIDQRTNALRPKMQEVEIPEQEELAPDPVEIITEEVIPVESVKRFCNSCDSKGVRHKKNCTR